MKSETTALTPQGCVDQLKEHLKLIQSTKNVKHKTHTEIVIENGIAMIERLIKPVAPAKITEFDVMKEMQRRDMEIAMYNKLVRLEMIRNGGEITISVDSLAYKQIMADQLPGVHAHKYMIGLYVVNREQYNEVKSEF
jgi:hypothetical protein